MGGLLVIPRRMFRKDEVLVEQSRISTLYCKVGTGTLRCQGTDLKLGSQARFSGLAFLFSWGKDKVRDDKGAIGANETLTGQGGRQVPRHPTQ